MLEDVMLNMENGTLPRFLESKSRVDLQSRWFVCAKGFLVGSIRNDASNVYLPPFSSRDDGSRIYLTAWS